MNIVAYAGASSKHLQEARQGPVNHPDLPLLRTHEDDDQTLVGTANFSCSAVFAVDQQVFVYKSSVICLLQLALFAYIVTATAYINCLTAS